MKQEGRIKLSIYSIIGGILIAGILIGLVVVLFSLSGKTRPTPPISSQVNITQIPAPTSTPILAIPTDLADLTPTSQAVLPPGVIGVGAYVQVSGTSGSGLRMRTEPGTNTEIRFIALDAEVFLVIGGPEEKDGYTWWQLEASYDKNRTGWSADAFLTAIIESTPSP